MHAFSTTHTPTTLTHRYNMLHICFKQNHKVLRDVRKKLLPMFIANNFLEDRDRKNGRSVMHHAVRQKSALLVKVRRRIVYFSDDISFDLPVPRTCCVLLLLVCVFDHCREELVCQNVRISSSMRGHIFDRCMQRAVWTRLLVIVSLCALMRNVCNAGVARCRRESQRVQQEEGGPAHPEFRLEKEK